MTAFHVARFGNKANAHDVLGHSGIPKEVLTTMVWRTDAPPNSEGLGLEPFVTAYRSGDYYVLHATTIDDDAPRAGMVVTTAAVVPLSDLGTLDVRALWEVLADGIDVEQPLNSDDFILAEETGSAHAHPPGSKAAASAVFESSRVVWTGPGFEDFVECLWVHLRPENRGRLVVAAAGHPERIPIPSEAESFTVVKSAEAARTRWSAWNSASQGSVGPPNAVRDALYGDDDGRAEQFAVSLELLPSAIALNTWRHLANAANLFAGLSHLGHGETRALLQLLGLLQPNAGVAVGLKNPAVGHLHDLTDAASFADIRGLRGVPWTSLNPTARDDLVAKWAEVVVLDPSRTNDVLEAAAEVAVSSDEFMSAVGGALAGRLLDEDVRRVCAAALASELGPRVLSWLVREVRTASAVDEVVSATLAAGRAAPAWLGQTATGLSLPISLAACVPVTDSVAAWTALTDLRPRSTKAEDLLEIRTGPSGMVRTALAIKDPGIVARAAKAVAADTTLLPGGSIEDEAFRELWFAGARAGADPWASARPSDVVGPLLAMLLAGEFVEPEVLTSLSLTTAADISSHGSRADLWARFPSAALKGFLEATAESVARSFQRTDMPPETQLASAVLAKPVLSAVAEESTRQALELLTGISSARASDAIVVAVHGRFSATESAALGGLIKSRQWRPAAEFIISLSASRSDLADAADVAGGMFSIFDRLAKFISSGSPLRPTVTTNELRSSVVEVTASLYKTGPMDDALWERAGGDAADLPTGTMSGRLKWGHAVEASMAGRLGAPTLTELVAIMLQDYPNNIQLQALKQTIENGRPT